MEKEKLKKIILKKEELRKIGKISRIFKDPLNTIPYYFMAAVARIRPFNTTFKTLWGDRMYADLPNGNTFLYYGFPEANLTNYLINHIDEESVFIDGGANIGFYSMLGSYLNNNKKTIHSFEPAPKTFEKLESNCRDKNIKTNNLALLDTEKNIKFIDYGKGYNSFNSLFRRNSNNIKSLKNRGTEIDVKCTTLDKYCLENNIAPTFIKLDLEGSEYLALLGAREVINKYKPEISIEVAGDEEWAENIKNSDEILRSMNYYPYQIHIDGTLSRHDIKEKYKYDNLIYKYDSN